MTSQIIGKIKMDDSLLQKDLEAISKFPILEEAYPEFGTGTWKNYSLWNKSGDYHDMQVQDSDTPAKITELGEQTPYINRVIKETFDTTYLRMVRARNLVNGFVFPHRDFVELNRKQEQYLRVFLPLETNTDSFHADENHVFQMQKNEIWKLDASLVHSAANFSNNTRIHVCLDFQFPTADFAIEDIFLNKDTMLDLATPTRPKRDKLTNISEVLDKYVKDFEPENVHQTLVDLAKYHFYYDVGIADCYDWLIDLAQKAGGNIVEKMQVLKKFMIEKRSFGEQFSFI